jgi:hypothetical protein
MSFTQKVRRKSASKKRQRSTERVGKKGVSQNSMPKGSADLSHVQDSNMNRERNIQKNKVFFMQ